MERYHKTRLTCTQVHNTHTETTVNLLNISIQSESKMSRKQREAPLSQGEWIQRNMPIITGLIYCITTRKHALCLFTMKAFEASTKPISLVVTARIQKLREGNVFTDVCLLAGGALPIMFATLPTMPWYPLVQVWAARGYRTKWCPLTGQRVTPPPIRQCLHPSWTGHHGIVAKVWNVSCGHAAGLSCSQILLIRIFLQCAIT